MKRRSLILAGLLSLAAAQSVHAADITLRLHQFLPPQAPIPSKAINTWIKQVEEQSEGRIKIKHFPSMQLGGKPPELLDQAKDGIVDIVWTVLGYTPGRFPKTEFFELPFTVGEAESGSRALQEYIETHATDEFEDIKLIAAHIHGPGLFHTSDAINSLEDLKGMKIRGGSRMINIMLKQLGATPVGMPIPAVGEALSKGVIDGTTVPWEVVPAFKIQQIVHNHTGFTGKKGLYASTFALAMNKNSYESLPDDLKKVIDDNSGADTSAMFGKVMDGSDKVGLSLAQKANNSIVTFDVEQTNLWREAASGVRKSWYEEVAKEGIDGPALAAAAEAIIEKHDK